ncbi:hypothetical protein F5880DRAFT_1628169, partial [Lentinula raphanica]
MVLIHNTCSDDTIYLISSFTMVNKAKSQELKARIVRAEKDDLEKEAVVQYLQEQSRELGKDEKRKGARQICEEVSKKHFTETGKLIKLNHATLISHSKGKTTMSEFNRTKQHLTPEEEDMIVKYVIDMAERGFPLSPRRIREHAFKILHSRLG